ncbi:MAG TPA: response regulator, partial [Nitrospira sp.]
LKLPEDQIILLFQSVRELLINSSKHAGTGEATVRMEQRDGLLKIDVRDEGAGFDLAAAASAGTPSGGISSEFGLFSIRERMRALGGSFDIQSAPGKGTTVTLTLPLGAVRGKGLGVRGDETKEQEEVRDNRLGVSSEYPSLFIPHPSRVRVLLVDDHIMVRQGLRSVLDAYADIELVGEAGNGEEAVKMVEQLRPAVVVMDINMPKMDGIEATREIKTRYPDLIVIGLSVNADRENQDRMQEAGAALLLTKEAAVEELHEVIMRHVGGARELYSNHSYLPR